MTKSEILAFLNANPVCYLATVDNGKPRVRGMMMFRADEQGLIFHSGAGKAMTQQLQDVPFAEVCFFNGNDQVQVRVAGDVEWIDDVAFKQAIAEERPFLKEIAAKIGWDALLVFRITHCQAAVWTMATNLAPTTWVEL
jgi:uncharacterized pyridoxamine 5'-phosphate oxidase family protein